MSFDNSRYIFNPFNNYSSVVMPQGRVQLDADWNEFLAEIARRIQAGTLDTMGRAVYPVNTTPDAFYISPSTTAWVVNIGQGRIYVDGLLAENHGPLPGTWDPALAELSGSPQPAPASISGTPSIPFTSQPMFPAAGPQTNPQIQQDLPNAAGNYLFYLDVWTREVTYLEDPFTANPALGPGIIDPGVGIDTSGRLQTVWQVRWMPAAMAGGSGPAVTCSTPDASISYPASSNGLLTNGVVPNTATGDCCLTTGTGYTGLENQLYRVQINKGGPIGTATFKWSRENASVATSVTSITQGANPGGAQATILAVASLGRDQVLNFTNGDWIELLDDNMELNGQPDPNYPSAAPYTFGSPGIMAQIDTVDPTTNTIYLVTPPLTNPPTASASLHTRILRWDTSPTLPNAENPVPTASTSVQLENGLTVSFNTNPANGNFLSGDFWTFSARTDGSFDQLTSAPPRGTHHHYTKLSAVTFNAGGTATSTPDCRTPWPPIQEGDCGCCTATVSANPNAAGAYTSIQQAINSLPSSGGTICILPGQYYESIVLNGLKGVTLRGCGLQTTLYAYSAAPAGQGVSNPTITTNSGIKAIITITNSQHIELTGFTVEAPEGMSCILIDQISTATQPSVEVAKPMAQVTKAKFASQATNFASRLKNAGIGAAQQVNAASAAMVSTQNERLIPGYYQNANWFGEGAKFETPMFLPSGTDVTLTGLVLAASTSPAIVAVMATLLNIAENRILMQDVVSLWPGMYLSGVEITVESNWIGLQDLSDAQNYATVQLVSDLSNNFNPPGSTAAGNGGIQIGGYSTGVSIVDNVIEGGAFNAISLGAILLFDPNQAQVSGLNGLFLTTPVTSTGTTLVLPPTDANGNTLAADGPLQNILIERNRISGTGLCPIGPVGFFTSTTPEVVSVANLIIRGNILSGSIQAPITPFPEGVTGLGYGAICLPDLQNVIVRDNSITDFGPQPGAQVCGIFILNGEQVEISRNQILETRDWNEIVSAPAALNGLQAGISIPMVSPPALNQTVTAASWTGASAQGVVTAGSPPVYQPGLPALRLDQNVVRIPLGYALDVTGYGPFSITGNQLTSGGTVPASTSFVTALTVSVVNLGIAIELDTRTTFTQLWGGISDPTAPTLQLVDNALSNSTSGTVLFSNNTCQLETRANGATGITNVLVVTLDNLNFANNLTWMDGGGPTEQDYYRITITALMDVLLVGGTANITSNRFQEGPASVVFSGITGGLANITTGNISTNCLFAEPNTSPFGVDTNNVCLAAAIASKLKDTTLCNDISKKLLNGYGATAAAGSKTSAGFTFPDTPVTTDPYGKINEAVTQVDSTASERIQQLTQTRQARLNQVKRIATTIGAQSGTTSAQAAAANADVTANQATVARFEMFKRQVAVPPPTVTATGWALYGMVYNSSHAPVSAYSLYLVDSTNTYQNTFGIAYTGSDGSFQIVYAGPPAGQTAPTAQLFVQVCNANGDPIYTSPTAFTPAPGLATYQAITLPAGEKPIGVLPIVFRDVAIPSLNKEINSGAPASDNTSSSTRKKSRSKKGSSKKEEG